MSAETVTDATITAEAATDLSAIVNQDTGLVQLFDPDGEPFLVPGRLVEKWVRQGYRRRWVDLATDRTALRPVFLAALAALEGLADEAGVPAGDAPAQLAAAHVALNELGAMASRYCADVLITLGVAEETPVNLQEPVETSDGSVVWADRQIDPGQVAHYLARGWRYAE